MVQIEKLWYFEKEYPRSYSIILDDRSELRGCILHLSRVRIKYYLKEGDSYVLQTCVLFGYDGLNEHLTELVTNCTTKILLIKILA